MSSYSGCLIYSSCLTISRFPFSTYRCLTRPLQVYTLRPRPRPRPPPGPLVEASSMLQSSPTLVPQPFDDLPIVIRKGTRSTSNSHPIYNFLSFHLYLYLTFPLFPPCLLSLPLKTLVRLSLIRARNRQWLRKWMLFTLMHMGACRSSSW